MHTSSSRGYRALAVVVAAALSTPAMAQRGAARSNDATVSAPIADVRYDVEFSRALAQARSLAVTTSFTTGGREAVLLSLPAWTPGAYELSNFARNVSQFAATGDGKALTWDKLDADTWRVQPAGAKSITVTFRYRADTLDNAMAWSRDNFVFFNGTNVFLHPEGRDLGFVATVQVKTESDWLVATGMRSTGVRTYTASNYHDAVDMPFFVGAIDLDSARIADKWVRLATYPRGAMAGESRRAMWTNLERMFPPMIRVFGDTPYDSYTNLLVFDSSYGGGSALEHANSHVGVYTPLILESPVLPSITAHEIFHLWNVKRMRPAELVPYRYDRQQPTTLLWVSEGITDYYADLALVRGGIIDSTDFLDLTLGKMDEVDGVPPVALEDASLSTWIHPQDGTSYIYYPKGSLAGLLLDIFIRDASDNVGSLDVVMRDVYERSKGRGFTAAEWWAAVSRAAGGKSYADFHTRYIDGREPFPYSAAFALAGFRIHTDTTREPRIGVYTAADSLGTRVTAVDPGSAAAEAGVRVGDYLLSIGDVPVAEGFGERFRARYGRGEGQSAPVRVRRGSQTLSLPMTMKMAIQTSRRLLYDRTANAKAARLRHGLLTGTTR